MKRVKVNAYQVGLVFKDDVYKRMLDEGTYWFWKGEKVMIYD
ncbi:MAG: slipin family protein, partial [Chitinophagaceae bacterium]